MTEADEDWIRVGRLQVKADAGDKEAAKELERIRNTPMYRLIELKEERNKT